MSTGNARINEPIASPSPPRTAFFNGRLLSAEDLQREQTLRETGQAQLFRLFGCGIARGLNVRGSVGTSVAEIDPGLGVAPSGQIIDFPGAKVDLAAAAETAFAGGAFANCAAAFGDFRGPTAGLYLLVLTPTWIAAGRAASLLGDVGSCNRNVELPSVRVRLVALSAPANPTPGTLRNRVATSLLAPQAGSADGVLGWLPRSLALKLTEDDLPLAAMQIDSTARITFLDSHAAQRRLAPPPGSSADALWPQSRGVEMEAFAQQCLAQLLDLAATGGGPVLADLISAFASLPPVLVWRSAALSEADRGFMRELLKHLAGDSMTVSRPEFARRLNEGLYGEPVEITSALFTWLAAADGSHNLLIIAPPDPNQIPTGGAAIDRNRQPAKAPPGKRKPATRRSR